MKSIKKLKSNNNKAQHKYAYRVILFPKYISATL